MRHSRTLLVPLPFLALALAGCFESEGGDEAADATDGETDTEAGETGESSSGSGEDSTDETDETTDETTDDTTDETTDETTDDETTDETGPGFECGNAVLELGEICDDGNGFDHDGCTAECAISPDLLAYWRFDEPDTDQPLADETGLFPADFIDDGGVLGGVYPSDGRGGSLYIAAYEARSALASGPIADRLEGTLSVWIAGASIGNTANAVVFWQGIEGGNGWGSWAEIRLGVTADNHFSLRVNSCLAQTSETAFENADGWFHVVGVWTTSPDGTNCTVTIAQSLEGELEQATQNGDGQLPPQYIESVHIGRADSDVTPNRFRGWIDELMVFGRALTPVEILELRAVQAEGGHYD